MTASRRSACAAAALLAGAVLAACRTPGAPPVGSAFERDPELAAIVPDVADYSAARLARAALLAGAASGDRHEVLRALDNLEDIDVVLRAAEEPPTGLVPVGNDLAIATLDDHGAYREASDELLHRGGVSPALRRRIQMFRDDDPLALADARIRDAWLLEFGRAFNTLAEPLGRSITSFALSPYRVSQAVLRYAVALYTAEPLPLQRRQALAHWKEYLERNPEGERSGEILTRVQRDQLRWNRTQRDRMLRVAESALDRGDARVALVYADRALRYTPEDRSADELREEAEGRLLAERERELRSVEASAGPAEDVAAASGRELALALLVPGGDIAAAASALLAAEPEGPLADEALFARALARGEAGDETGMWDTLETLAEGDPEISNMARHARALRNGHSNPYGAFERARSLDRWRKAGFVFVGPWVRGVPRRGLPEAVEWGLALPSMAQFLLSFPLRLIQVPWMPATPEERAAAVAARRYLARDPDGAHAQALRAWLIDLEESRENWYAVLQFEEERGTASPEELDELREKAARQFLRSARREERRELRLGFLRRVAREFPETRAAHEAGMLVRAEVEEASPQSIRISRGFLLENPQVAGPRGLALRPGLLDDDPANGELHPLGVTLLGGLEVELDFVAASGDPDDPPERRYQALSEPQLARVVSLLEERQLRNSLVDDDDVYRHDASRDLFFERARLGLADRVDVRPGAGSTYVFLGMRERYGMVRSRKNILPFDLVLSGSLTDLSLGAFPRIRPPRETPDAILYK